jgi:hypothetical protein
MSLTLVEVCPEFYTKFLAREAHPGAFILLLLHAVFFAALDQVQISIVSPKPCFPVSYVYRRRQQLAVIFRNRVDQTRCMALWWCCSACKS